MRIDDIAAVCHNVNRAICRSFGDDSQKSWADAEEWQRNSAMDGVAFRLANPNGPESAQHDNWCHDKRVHGWKHGPVKDATKKEHPCLIPFDQLPPEQKVKDLAFCAVVDSLKGGLK